MTREQAIYSLRNASIRDVYKDATVYGQRIEDFDREEMLVLCGWLMSQLARLDMSNFEPQGTLQ